MRDKKDTLEDLDAVLSDLRSNLKRYPEVASEIVLLQEVRDDINKLHRECDAAEARAERLQSAFNTEVRVCSERTKMLQAAEAGEAELRERLAQAEGEREIHLDHISQYRKQAREAEGQVASLRDALEAIAGSHFGSDVEPRCVTLARKALVAVPGVLPGGVSGEPCPSCGLTCCSPVEGCCYGEGCGGVSGEQT